MTKLESMTEAITRERQQRETFSETELIPLIRDGEHWEVVEDLLFFTIPGDFLSLSQVLRQKIEAVCNTNDGSFDSSIKGNYLRFLVDLTLALRSFLPRWNLQDADRHGYASLTDVQIEAEADKVQALAVELAGRSAAIVEKLLDEWQEETTARFKAEGASDPESEAQAFVGDSVGKYMDNAAAGINRSHLRRIVEARDTGQTITELSNDYAAFLKHAFYLGASFATTNPPLVDAAWLAEPERWNPIVDNVISDNPEASDDELARLVTLEVVLENMRLLRPIFLLTEGKMGCVCCQVNPNNHGDAETMISDALFFYEKLQGKLGGGIPNVVFKLPGTKAGLEACYALTRQAIGVTITVNFGLFQHLPFVQAIHEGQAIFSCLVEMSGRLAYPVRDEMLTQLDELAACGINEARAREAAAWSGIAVLKRLHGLLAKKGYHLGRIKTLVASLRIYEGDSYQDLPSAFPDITEIVGASILSVFPNVRRPFEVQPVFELDPQRIESPVPDDVMAVLAHSEIFKQAYYVSDRSWMPEGDKRFQPDYELTLPDEEGTIAWIPVNNTLTEFCDSYDTFVQRILARKQPA